MYHSGHNHYHAIRLTELRRLYWAHTVKQLASSMTLIFVPIYLYNLQYSLQAILWFFLLLGLFWLVLQYPIMKISNHIGANKAMSLGLILNATQVLMLASLSVFHWPLWSVALIWSISVAFYWPNFRACFAKSLLHKRAGRAAGVSVALTTLAYGIAPAIGGVIASSFSITLLYVLGMILFAAAAAPLFHSPEIVQNDSFNLRDLNIRKVRRDLIANFSETTDDSILGIIWPLFIFLIIPSYVGVGLLSSISVIAGIIIALYVGKREENKGARKYLKNGASLTAFTNGIRLLTHSTSQIAGVNFVNGLGHALVATPFNAHYYENANREALLPYIYAMMMVSALSTIVLFAILLLVSTFAPIQTVLLVGLFIAIPASFAIRLIR